MMADYFYSLEMLCWQAMVQKYLLNNILFYELANEENR